MKTTITLIALLLTTAAWAETPYPVPKNGRETITRTGACPTGYVGLGKKCEALHKDTPRAWHALERVVTQLGAAAPRAAKEALASFQNSMLKLPNPFGDCSGSVEPESVESAQADQV